jgi:hypothetical protein
MKKQLIRHLLIVTYAVIVAGCGNWHPSTQTIKCEGITLEIPFQTNLSSGPIESSVNTDGTKETHTGFIFTGETITIQNLDGNLTINGKRHGTVTAGDKVRVDKSGQVSVNGSARPST